MALTITLPQDLEKQLREMAADRGESVESLVASAVRQFERLKLLRKIDREFHSSIELLSEKPAQRSDAAGLREALQNYKLDSIVELSQVVVPNGHDSETGPISSPYDPTVKTSRR
jgi:hypothetical protein